LATSSHSIKSGLHTVDCALFDWTEFGKVVYSEKT
jgi:hypothetical protein